MTEGWSYGGAPRAPAGAAGSITLIEGLTFCICDRVGDIHPGAEHGLFYRDTRFLDSFRLEVDGQHLEPLDVACPTPYSATFVARRPPRPGTADSTLLVVRDRYVGNGMLERITVRNLGRETAGAVLSLVFDADFAGLFEVKEGRARSRPDIEREADGATVRLAQRSPPDHRGVRLSGTGQAMASPGQLSWQVVIAPRDERTVSAEIAPVMEGQEISLHYRAGQPVEASQPAAQMAAWREAAPAITTPDERLSRLLATSAEDLGALRVFDPDEPDHAVVAAGVPWFMTLFGRDSLLTSWMVLPHDGSLALGTLQTLARLQGTKVEPMSEEEPGRILHEVRSGLDAEMSLGGGNVYYGSVDATPLFVMLLGELRRWGLARRDIEALLPAADRALSWIDHFGDRDGDGFVEYQRATDRGLLNQGWKDSFDAISFASGTLAEPPIALAEVQGYVYAAYLARGHFADEVGDHELAEHWRQKAHALKRRFNEEFWLPERGHYALALDGQKRPVDALASNIGHCLWTGIVDEQHAPDVAGHLTGPDMFTGFGVRTLAASMGAYNPMSYHNGSVWPHDNAIVAAGLMRYGFIAEAQRVASALFDAADLLGGRFPELFCGFDRSDFSSPVPYPTSCTVQAWAAATPLSLLRTLLRFDPWIPFGRLWCSPAVPEAYLPLRVDRLQIAGSSVTLDVGPDGWTVDGLPDGVEVIGSARRPLTASAPPHLTEEARRLLTNIKPASRQTSSRQTSR
ncbi:MAG: amylo-alpha-1,6-glucosidase [Acidimicrobiales bacterium]